MNGKMCLSRSIVVGLLSYHLTVDFQSHCKLVQCVIKKRGREHAWICKTDLFTAVYGITADEYSMLSNSLPTQFVVTPSEWREIECLPYLVSGE